MVYRGKPSAACGECRKRRSRCDQALPACGQCIKAKRICPGYRNTADLLFFDESSQVVKKNRTRAAAPSISVRVRPPIRLTGVVLYQPLNDLAVNFFMSNYVGHDSTTSQFDYLPGFYLRDIVPKPELRQSIEAVGLAGYAKASRRSDLVLPATRSYVSAIRDINHALSNDLSAQQDSTLLSVILLAMFEVMILPRASGLQNVTKHLNGATSIATLRLQQGITTEYGNKLIGTLVQAVVLNCWMQNIPLPPEFIVLREHLDDRLTKASMHAGFLGLVMDLIQFRSALNSRMYESEMIKLEAYALDARFKAFGDNLPPESHFKSYWSAAEIDQLVYKGCYHVYPGYFTAHLWNNVRLCRIRLHRVILSQYTTPTSSPMGSTSVYPQIARCEGVIQELARDICASVPQLSGYLARLESYSKMENDASMPREPVSKTSTGIPLPTHFHYDPDPFKQQQHSPATPKTDVSLDSDFPAPRLESLYHILYHLHIISNIEFLPASMRNWAHGRIAWMEANADPEELSQLRAILNSRTEAGFPVLVDAIFPGRKGGGNAGNMGQFILKRPISFHHFY